MITGTRDPDNQIEHLVRNALLWVSHSKICAQDAILFQGEARGVDSIAKKIWNRYGMKNKGYEALWSEHGKAAGGIRNQEMVDAQPDICLAFPSESSKGTWDAVRRAKKAGVLTFVLTDQDSMYTLYYYTLLNPGVTLEQAQANLPQ